MEEDLRARLADELAARSEPPLGDLVAGALRQGKRLRLVRRARIAAGTLVVVGVLAVGSIVGVSALFSGPQHRGVPSASQVGSPQLTIAPTPTDPVTLPTTDAALAYRLRQLLPPGQTNGFAAVSGLDVRAFLDRGHGEGTVELSISTGGQPCAVGQTTDTTCVLGADGAHVEILHNTTNCLQTTIVAVQRADGVVVYAGTATCLPWRGGENQPAPQVLSTDELTTLASDPSWGTRMSAALVTAGATAFPHL